MLAAGTVLADEGENNGSVTYDHEACGYYNKFDYDEDDSRLAWGARVLCSAGINYIFMSAELMTQTSACNWVIMDFDVKTCWHSLCEIEIDLHYVPSGNYKIIVCFQAQSPTSEFPWGCYESGIKFVL